jgi:hypothetical protein
MECQVCLDNRRCLICGGRGRAVVASVSIGCAGCNGTGRCPSCSNAADGAVSAVGRVPRQGRPATAEAGRVRAAGQVHAVRKTLAGNQAWCGAGPIAAMQAGRYDPDGDDACLECLAALIG